ncbi:ribonuclease domain-containing protein [Corynebacteriaceae bacterium 7-707]
MSTRNSRLTGGLAGAAGAAVLLVAGYLGLDAVTGDDDAGHSGGGGNAAGPAATGETCEVASLPEQADEVIDSILGDGGFDHPGHDGKHFGNYEGRLPEESGGYYREYTVSTPGLDHRGARRIVVGGGTDTDPDVWYYTPDHYESFCAIPDAEE